MPDLIKSITAAALRQILEDGATAVMITLIAAPANVGAKLLVVEPGAIAGSLGASGLDDAVAKYAADFLTGREEVRSIRV